MKKLYIISFVVFLTLILVVTAVLYAMDSDGANAESGGVNSISNDSHTYTDISTSEPNQNYILLETGENYTVEAIRDPDRPLDRYLVKVYSDKGEFIGELKTRLYPEFIRTTWNGENVLGIRDSAGTGRAVVFANFFRLSVGTRSETFYYYLDSSNGLVISGELDGVIVRDIFDENGFNKKFDTFEEPLAEIAADIFDARFLDNGKSIEITYRTQLPDGTYGTNVEVFEIGE